MANFRFSQINLGFFSLAQIGLGLAGLGLVALGLMDWVLGLTGIHLYRVLGIVLPPDIDAYSAVIAIGAGAVAIALSEGGIVTHDMGDLMGPDETLIFCRRVRVRPGKFGPSKTGFLFLSNQRIGYRGDLPKAYKHLEDGSLDTTGFVWDLKALSAVERQPMALLLTAGEQQFRVMTNARALKTIAQDIQSQRQNQR